MRNRIKFSVYSLIITVIVLVLCVVGIFSLLDDASRLIMFCIIMGAATLSGLFYCPISVEADNSGIRLNRLLSRSKFFAYADIGSVDICYPSAAGIRLCGSGGFFGSWGYFNDIMIGTYFGYYGSRDNCFLIRMKNGRQYVVGCEDAVAMVGFIKSHIGR